MNLFFPVEESEDGKIFSLFEKTDVAKLKVSIPEIFPTTDRIEESFRSLLGCYSNEKDKKYHLVDFDGRTITPAELAHKYYRSPEVCFIKGYSD